MQKNVCGKCGLIFHCLSDFDAHRTGNYGKPIYRASSTGNSQKVIGYTPVTRRCLSLDEMLANNFHQLNTGYWTVRVQAQQCDAITA